ncbi:hypothetical protein [Bradyrhizobium sp. WSM2793]|uniref:hypothetical protein n=1 Tax=Bradyrhizobium sp. WSM2793 TaxID=1038866 RepID=UPI0012F99E64|nr:hypothetical protein [Bradyrhizobium sp. WSM2793]
MTNLTEEGSASIHAITALARHSSESKESFEHYEVTEGAEPHCEPVKNRRRREESFSGDWLFASSIGVTNLVERASNRPFVALSCSSFANDESR